MEILLGTSFLIMAIIPILLWRKICAPYVLVSGTWGLFLIAFIFADDHYFTLGNRFFFSILLWVIFFYIGSISGEYFTKKSQLSNNPDTKILKFYFIITPIFAVITAYMSIKAAMNSSNMFLYLRMMNTGLDDSISAPDKGVFVYLTSLILILFLLELAMNGLRRKKIITMLFFLNLLLVFVTMAKSLLFTTVISAAIILLSRKEISMRNLFYIGVGLIAIFILMQSVRSVDGEVSTSFIGNYFFANAVAFEYADMTDIGSDFGSYVFRFIYAVGNRLGLTSAPVATIMDYTYTGKGITNTYTVLYPFYHDFGFVGVAIFGLLVGYVCGFFYKKSTTSIPAKVFYSALASTIVFQFFGEILITNASMYLQYLIYSYLPFVIKLGYDRNINGNIQWWRIS